jgi:hypothetical protein
MTLTQLFWLGVLGGVFTELLGHYKMRETAPEAFPKYLKSPYYWIVTVLMVFAGGGLTAIYAASKIELSAIVAVNVGASAPLILGALARRPPPEVN